MFKKYKEFKRQKYENQLKEIILFNEWRINSCKEYPNPITPPMEHFDESEGICQGYCEDFWAKLKKLGVNKELWDKHIETCDLALKEHYELQQRLKEDKINKEKQEKIELYKQAILELKREGKI